jgi:uncharacterized protein (TIGR03067 family)
MIRTAIVLFVLLAFFSATIRADEKAKAAEKDLNALQGVWLVEAAHQDGKQVPEKDRQSDKYCLYAVKVTNDKFEIAFLKDKTEYGELGSSMKPNPSATPKILEFVNQNQMSVQVAYAIDGDKLTVCFQLGDLSDFNRDKFPKTLETKPGDNLYLFVFKRMKVK